MSDFFEAPNLEYLGQHLPQFEFEDFIAQGGMGAVYRARQISLDRTVAIKVLPQELGQNVEFRDSFSKEAKAMAKLNHPNLIGVFDSGDVDGMPYIAMEFIEGQSLHDAAWGKTLESEQAVNIVKGICDGLADAHRHGIIHRDIKPANILLTMDANPKIGDFGLAHPSDSDEEGLIMGTPGYTAPEIFEDTNLAGVLADQYSVGMILHQLLTGIDPAGTEGPPTVATGNIRLDAIWRKATKRNPVERYASIADMSADLDKWKNSKTTAPGGRALNVGAPGISLGAGGMSRTPPVQLQSAKSGRLIPKLIIFALLAGIGWYGYQYYEENLNPANAPLADDETPSTKGPTPTPKPATHSGGDDSKPVSKPKRDRTANPEGQNNPNKKKRRNNRRKRTNPSPEIPDPNAPSVSQL